MPRPISSKSGPPSFPLPHHTHQQVPQLTPKPNPSSKPLKSTWPRSDPPPPSPPLLADEIHRISNLLLSPTATLDALLLPDPRTKSEHHLGLKPPETHRCDPFFLLTRPPLNPFSSQLKPPTSSTRVRPSDPTLRFAQLQLVTPRQASPPPSSCSAMAPLASHLLDPHLLLPRPLVLQRLNLSPPRPLDPRAIISTHHQPGRPSPPQHPHRRASSSQTDPPANQPGNADPTSCSPQSTLQTLPLTL